MSPAAAAAAFGAVLLLTGCSTAPAAADDSAAASAGAGWHSLFDGRTLAGWTPVEFGGEGAITVRDGAMILEPGGPLTGVTATPDLPSAYELRVVCARRLGTDFFCGLTFPVRRSHLTLVLGGWGGTVCGLSSLDGLDAARNDTRTLRHFPTGTPVEVVVRVTDQRVAVAIDGAPFLAADLQGHELGLRAEMEPCRPFGFCCYATRAALTACAWRPLPTP